MKKPRCLNPTCSLHGNVESSHIIRYGFYRTTAGKRRRYRCVRCGHASSTTKGTPYYRLQHRRTRFDTVGPLRVEGVSLSAIARSERLAWNTVARWLEAHLELLRCYYNFVRPHGALTFGRETRTPAMQAGLATRRLTLRDIFVSLRHVARWLRNVLTFADSRRTAAVAVMYMPVAA